MLLNNKTLYIVYYHNVGVNNFLPNSKTENEFQLDLEYYKNNFNIISFKQIEDLHLVNNNKPFLLITFDDNYKDSIVSTSRILKQFGIRAVYNLTACTIFKNKLMIRDKLFIILDELKKNKKLFEISDLIDSSADTSSIIKSTKKLKNVVQENIYEKLWEKYLKISEKEFIESNDLYIGANEIKNSLIKDHDIGLHTTDHINMTLYNDEEIIEQIKTNKELFKNHLGVSSNILSIPYGIRISTNLINKIYHTLEVKYFLGINFKYSDNKVVDLKRNGPLILERLGMDIKGNYFSQLKIRPLYRKCFD